MRKQKLYKNLSGLLPIDNNDEINQRLRNNYKLVKIVDDCEVIHRKKFSFSTYVYVYVALNDEKKLCDIYCGF